MQLTPDDFHYPARCLGGFFFGLYSGIFAVHLQIHASRKEYDDRKQNIVFHALWVLYVLSAAVIVIDIAEYIAGVINHDMSMMYNLDITEIAVFGCCDFIAQSILIHRCWIVWGHNIYVVIIPSILASSYLVMWIAGTGAHVIIGQDEISETHWGNILDLTSLTASMTVNALVTGLIVFRIFRVFREVKSATTSDEISLGVAGGEKLHSIIFITIESGVTLLAIQLARLALAATKFSTDVKNDPYPLIQTIHEMLNGITPTIILVRVSMGLSFHDEPSLAEAVGSFQFVADNLNPIAGMGSLSQDRGLCIEPVNLNATPDMVNIIQERRDGDDRSDEIKW